MTALNFRVGEEVEVKSKDEILRTPGHGDAPQAVVECELGRSLVAVTVDAHTTLGIDVAYSAVEGDPSTAAGLLAALPTASLVPGRASHVARAPMAKQVQRARGNRRVKPAGPNGARADVDR